MRTSSFDRVEFGMLLALAIHPLDANIRHFPPLPAAYFPMTPLNVS